MYRFPKPNHTGQTYTQLTPLDFIEKIVALIPPPHRHRRHYHGVFAPSSPLRQKVAANAKKRPEAFTPVECTAGPDPPWEETCNPPHWEDRVHFDSAQQDYIDPQHCAEL